MLREEEVREMGGGANTEVEHLVVAHVQYYLRHKRGHVGYNIHFILCGI